VAPQGGGGGTKTALVPEGAPNTSYQVKPSTKSRLPAEEATSLKTNPVGRSSPISVYLSSKGERHLSSKGERG